MKEKLAEEYAERVCNGKFPIEYTRSQVVAHTKADFIAGWEAKEASIGGDEVKEAVIYELENIIDYWFDGETPNYKKVEFKLKMRKQINNIFNSPLTKEGEADKIK